ncbi:MAG: flavin oxidoreductase, partial [Bacteroidia bacterium]
EDFFAPYVNESPLKIGLMKEEELFFKINGTTLIIASIQQIILEKEMIKDDGFVDLNQANIITGSGLDAYLKTKKIARLSYAKPDKELATIKF